MEHPRIPPLDFVTHRGQGTIIGAFRCPTSHERFKDSGPIQNDIFVFPRSSVRIRHSGGSSFVADHTVATVYNRGQVYDRIAVSEEGDRSDWFSVPRSVATEAVTANGLEPSTEGPFSFAFVPVRDRTYLAQRHLFRRARRGTGTPSHVVDEGIYALLDDVVSAAAVSRQGRSSARVMERSEMAEETRSLLSARCEEDWPLSRLAGYFGVSQFRLCRAFRRSTGSTIHKYLLTVRLRASLERLELPGTDLSALAHDLGFSGHSHFSSLFRRAFGQRPSICRSLVADPVLPGEVEGMNKVQESDSPRLSERY